MKEKLKKVRWQNIDQQLSLSDDLGKSSKTHLTISTELSGKTLCGKVFPKDKGVTSNVVKFCKSCLKKAYKMGYEKGFTKELDLVEGYR